MASYGVNLTPLLRLCSVHLVGFTFWNFTLVSAALDRVYGPTAMAAPVIANDCKNFRRFKNVDFGVISEVLISEDLVYLICIVSPQGPRMEGKNTLGDNYHTIMNYCYNTITTMNYLKAVAVDCGVVNWAL